MLESNLQDDVRGSLNTLVTGGYCAASRATLPPYVADAHGNPRFLATAPRQFGEPVRADGQGRGGHGCSFVAMRLPLLSIRSPGKGVVVVDGPASNISSRRSPRLRSDCPEQARPSECWWSQPPTTVVDRRRSGKSAAAESSRAEFEEALRALDQDRSILGANCNC